MLFELIRIHCLKSPIIILYIIVLLFIILCWAEWVNFAWMLTAVTGMIYVSGYWIIKYKIRAQNYDVSMAIAVIHIGTTRLTSVGSIF